ncbi:hypothetical protein Rsub_05882 [Raphidocelis subcapitata]|uniref:Patatin n=1 Tax=Raphidocelis subcapitata TaxID=307507 RepID=A0A2V0NZT8_9CHLO|nr:hypothetical protein Rsub_05882 [Raphidocelis subcapitata]|eukprot:GBF93151.1 hypothetical protein Rsub_05882 [Raphidocelis subcapitata]
MLPSSRQALPARREGARPGAAGPRRRPRDVGAGVFGTFRAPPLPLGEGLDLRRFLDAAPRLGGAIVLPRPQQQQQQAQQAQQQAQAQALMEQLMEQQQRAVPAAAEGKKPLRLSWAGSGIYFWWQLGAMHYLSQRYDLTRVPMVGASGGAICAALARCGVSADTVATTAQRLSREHRIWDKPMGLAGAWGRVIEAWLHEVLPDDAAARCSGGLGIVVTRLPGCDQVAIDEFRDKTDLVDAIMASAHVPLLLDGSLARWRGGVPLVDGSFPDFFNGENCDHLQCGGDAVVFDYFCDDAIVRQGRFDMLSLKRLSEIRRIVLLGARYAARLEREAFHRFDLDAVRLEGAAAAGGGAGAGPAAAEAPVVADAAEAPAAVRSCR